MSDESLRDLYGDATPPPELEARLDRTLRNANILGGRRPRWRVPAAAALMLVAVCGSYLAGRLRPASASMAGTYVLLLYEESTYRDDRPIHEIVAEYTAWADSLSREGRLVLAEKLGDARYDVVAAGELPEPRVSESAPTGMFIVRAPDADAAMAIARQSPHVRQGGLVVVRPIAAHGDADTTTTGDTNAP